MRLGLSAIGAVVVLAGIILWHRRSVRLHTPSLVQDLARWSQAMPLAKPRQIYTGTQPVDRKALARALKGTKPTTAKARRLRLVPDDTRRIG